jgi:hypothetical protein
VLAEHRRVGPAAGEQRIVARRGGQQPAIAREQGDEAVAAGVDRIEHRLQHAQVD